MLRRQKDVLSQSTTPFTCTLILTLPNLKNRRLENGGIATLDPTRHSQAQLDGPACHVVPMQDLLPIMLACANRISCCHRYPPCHLCKVSGMPNTMA